MFLYHPIFAVPSCSVPSQALSEVLWDTWSREQCPRCWAGSGTPVVAVLMVRGLQGFTSQPQQHFGGLAPNCISYWSPFSSGISRTRVFSPCSRTELYKGAECEGVGEQQCAVRSCRPLIRVSSHPCLNTLGSSDVLEMKLAVCL